MPEDVNQDQQGNVAPVGGGGIDPQQAVSGPATFLLVVGIIGVCLGALSLILNLAGVGLGAAAGGDQAAMNIFSGAIGAVFAVVGAIGSAVVTFGALKMKKLENYTLAMAASIVAMLPILSGCCLLGIPAGIWCLVVLCKPEVKSAFH